LKVQVAQSVSQTQDVVLQLFSVELNQ